MINLDEWKIIHKLAWRSAIHEYRIRRIERAIALAPLSEVRETLDCLKRYDMNPCPANLKKLNDTYRELYDKYRKTRRRRREFDHISEWHSYTESREIYREICHVIFETTHPPSLVSDADIQLFVKAKFLPATRIAFEYVISGDHSSGATKLECREESTIRDEARRKEWEEITEIWDDELCKRCGPMTEAKENGLAT